GVTAANVNFATETAYVSGDASTDAIKAAIARAGYGVKAPAPPAATPVTQERKDLISIDRDLAILIVGAVLAVPLILPMMISWLPQEIAASLGLSTAMVPLWLQLLLATILQVGLGAGFYRSAYRALRGFSANMDTLVALGTSAAYGLSLYLVVT